MPKQTTRLHRKPITVTRAFLFSDLRDYTSFVEAKGDAAAARLLREYRTLVRRELARHDGAEVKTEGDSFYVVFERASTALECAIAILRAVEVRTERDPSAPLRIGVGLHAGETVEYDDQFVGSAVNIASRLAGKAAAMELVISDTLRGLVRTSQTYPMSERGPLDLKGVAEPIRAWSVEWREPSREEPPSAQPLAPAASAPAAASGQLLCPVVIGRTSEFARFTVALDAAVAGTGQVIVLGGEAGVGKTRFVREAHAGAAARGMRVLLGATHQSDGTLPYAPFVSAVRSGFRGLAREQLGQMLQRSAPDLAALFPELTRLDRASAPSTLERHRMGVAFQHLFRSFAHEAPLLVVLEDVHWADATSLELLQELARELRDARVAILATYRTDELHRRHPLLRTLAELQRERLVTEIVLGRLSAEETRELIRSTMATRDPNVQVSDEFRDALYSRAEGNPFFTEELLKALVESGGVSLGENGWTRRPIAELSIPGSVREAVRARGEQLSESARSTLATASVIGQRFPFELARVVRGLDDTALETDLRVLIEAQLISEAGRDTEEYAFRHALTREVVYDDLMVRERKRLHRAVADSLERDPRIEPALLAHHLLAAGERERAVPVLLRAGDRALQAGAPREAAAHYSNAVDIGVPDAQLARVVELQAEAYHLYDQALAVSTASEAAKLYADLGDARGRSRMLRLEGRALFYLGRHPESEARTREAIDVVGRDESVELARAKAQLAGTLMVRYDMAEALPLAQEAVALAERVGDPFALANALITRGSVYMDARGVPDLERGIDVARRGGVHEAVMRGYNNLQLALINACAPWQERLRSVEDALEYGRERGYERGTTHYILNHLLYLQVGRGEWDAALAIAAELESSSSPAMTASALRVQAMIVAAREGPRAALTFYERLASAGDVTTSMGRIMTAVDTAQGFAAAGEVDAARRALDQIATLVGETTRADALDTPVSTTLGGGGAFPAIIAATLLSEPRWLDAVEQALRGDAPNRQNSARLVAASRAVLDGDAVRAAAHANEARSALEQTGFYVYWTEVTAAQRLALRTRGIALGPAWEPIDEELRAFARKVGATARLAELTG